MIATGRNRDALQSVLARGADEVVELVADDSLKTSPHDVLARGVDVVLDYLWGPSAEQILTAAATAEIGDHALRFIQIGMTSAPTITLPGAPLHASAIEIKGGGVDSVSREAISLILTELLNAAPRAGFQVATREFPLDRVEEAWAVPTATPRIVVTMHQQGEPLPPPA